MQVDQLRPKIPIRSSDQKSLQLENDQAAVYSRIRFEGARQILKYLQTNAFIEKDKISRFYVFGSAAKQLAGPNSDLDLFMVFNLDPSNKNIGEAINLGDHIRQQFEPILRYKIDVNVDFEMNIASSNAKDDPNNQKVFYDELLATGINLLG